MNNLSIRRHPVLSLLLALMVIISSVAAAKQPASIPAAVRSSTSTSTIALSRSIAPAAASAFKNCIVPINPPTCSNLQVFLVIDDSSSMLYTDPTRQRLDGVRNVLDILAKEYYLPAVDANARDPNVKLPNIQVALIHFSSAVRYNSGWKTINPKSIDEWSAQLKAFDADLDVKIDYTKEQHTDYIAAFQAAAKLAADKPQTPDCPRLVMLFTDGVPNLGLGNLGGSVLTKYMQDLQGVIQPTFNRSNDLFFVTAFESDAFASFWNGVYKQKWEEITKDSATLDPRRALYVPTKELASRMESITGSTIGDQVYTLKPIPGKPQQYTTDIPITVESLRLTYYTINTSASFTVTGPDGNVIQPDGKNTILTGANTSIQVLEILNPAPGSYQVATTATGGMLTQLVRFEKITAKLASPPDAVLQFTNGQIGIQLLGTDGKPLAISAQMSIQAMLTQGGKPTDLTLTPGSDTFTTGWMPLTTDKATVDACATLKDSKGETVVLYNGPVGEIAIDPVTVQAGEAEKACVPTDQDMTLPLQLINGRNQQPVTIDMPVQWTSSSISSPGGTQLSSSIHDIDAKTGKYVLSFRPTSAGDVQSTVTASAIVSGVNYPFYNGQITSSGYQATRHLALSLGNPETVGDQLSAMLYAWFHPITTGNGTVIVFGRHMFGWFGPTQVQISGRFIDTDKNASEPGIGRFAVQLVSPSGGPSSEALSTWNAPGSGIDYNTVVFRSPGLGLYNVTITDQGSNPACTVLASLPAQSILLINDFWEYLIILILILILLLIILLLVLFLLGIYRNRLWGVLGLMDKDEDHVMWKGYFSHPHQHDGKSRYRWVFKEPICQVHEIRVRSWDQRRHHLLITVKTLQGRQSFKRSLDHWEDCELRDGCKIVWWPEEPHPKKRGGSHGDDELNVVEVAEEVAVVKDRRGDEVVVDEVVEVAEDKRGDIVEVEEITVIEEEEESEKKKGKGSDTKKPEKKPEDADDKDAERKRKSGH